MKLAPQAISPASFITFSPAHKTLRKTSSDISISELFVREEPKNLYDAKIQEMREKFNDTYYKFLSKITFITSHADVVKFHEQDVRSLFTNLIETRIALEEGEETTARNIKNTKLSRE